MKKEFFIERLSFGKKIGIHRHLFSKCIRVLCNDLKGKVLMEFWRRHLCGQTPAGSYVLVLEAMIEAEENSLTIKKDMKKMLAYVLNYSTALPHG